MNRKVEAIQQLYTRIQSMIEGADETEPDTFESLEIQGTIIEKVVHFRRYLEKNNAMPHQLDGSRDLVVQTPDSQILRNSMI